MDGRGKAGPSFMIKILFINHVSRIGGAEMSMLDLLEHLDRDRYVPIVACPPSGALPNRLERLDVRVERCSMTRLRRKESVFRRAAGLFRYIAAVCVLSRIVARHGIGIIHANSTNAQLYGGVVAALCRVPSVWHVRDLVPLGIVGRILYRLSTRIVVPSEDVRREIVTYRGRRGHSGGGEVSVTRDAIGDGPAVTGGETTAKVLRIHNGIDIERWREGMADHDETGASLRTKLGMDSDALLVGMIAQFVAWKGHRHFIEAARRVDADVPKSVFIIVGEDLHGDDPRYGEDLRRLSLEMGIQHKVVFTGHVDDIVPVMRDLDLLVLPSLREPFGRVIVEAMAAGKAVISTDAGGPPEIIQHGVTGLLVAPGDPGAMADAIISLLRDPELREKMGRVGRKRAEEHFAIEKCVREIEAVYESCIEAWQR